MRGDFTELSSGTLSRRTFALCAVSSALVTAWGPEARAQGSAELSSAAELARLRENIAARRSEIDRLTQDGPAIAQDEARLKQARDGWPTRLADLRRTAGQEFARERERIEATRAQDLARVDSEKRANDERWARAQAQREQYLRTRQNPAELERQIEEQNAELNRVRRERDVVISELQRGLFCSECGDSKYEIERDGSGQTFEQHLQIVGGRPVAKPEKVRAKQTEYANKIAGITGKIGQLRGRVASIQAADRQSLERLQAARQSFEEGKARLEREAQEIETAFRGSQSGLPAKRAELDARIAAEEDRHKRQLEVMAEAIDQKREQHGERIRRLQDALSPLLDYEGLLATQANFDAQPRTAQDAHTEAVLQRLDRLLDGPSEAEIRADAQLVRDAALLRQIEAVEAIVNTNPTSPDSDAGANAREAIAAWLMRELGLDSSERIKAETEAAYRARLIRRQRRVLGLEPVPHECLANPQQC